MKLVDKKHPMLYTPAKRASLKQERETGRAMLKFLALHNRRNQKTGGPIGIGLASNQVGIHGRVCVVLSFAYGPLVLVNPKIISSSEVYYKSEETCLSLGDAVYLDVPRAAWCLVEAENHPEQPFHFGAKAGNTWNDRLLMDARCVQHEINHLYGVLISDLGKKKLTWR